MTSRALAAGAVAVAVAVVAGGAVAAPALTGRTTTPAAGATGERATAEITRSDLVDTKKVGGTLRYSGRRAQPNRARGTVTRTRAEGSVVRRGGWLYRVDARPVILMYGTTPVYRTLTLGTSGADVEQLERNLAALGYPPGTVDHHFGRLTARAVLAWQRDQRLTRTGTVDAAQVIVASGPLRIGNNTAPKGDPAGASVVTTTDITRRVHIDLPASYQQFARIGAKVTVETPDGRKVKGRISSIAATATAGKGQDAEATIGVEATVTGRLGRLDQAPVTVELQTERHEDVLSVPVEALLALRDGAYGVRVVAGTTARVVTVTTGLFAVSRVEISGAGLAAGMRVEVPKT